jgi:hypothetical protein
MTASTTQKKQKPRVIYTHKPFAGVRTELLLIESNSHPSYQRPFSPPNKSQSSSILSSSPIPTFSQSGDLKAYFENVKLVFYMIPGNPGLVSYYENFLRGIWELSSGQVVCFGVEHPGHQDLLHPHQNSGHNINDHRHQKRQQQQQQQRQVYNHEIGKPLTLKEQCRHKIHVLDYLVQRYPNAKIIMAGHSIGAYMAVQVRIAT